MSSKWALQKNLIAKIVKGNEPNNLTTISEMTKNFLPKQELSSTTISRVLFWTSKVAFWRPDLTDVNTCAIYSHWREWLPVGVRDLKNVARSLWLAEWRVPLRVCKHGYDVKIFCFSRTTYHAGTNWKTFLSWKLDKFTLFTYSFVGWNLENLYKDLLFKTSRLVRTYLLVCCVKVNL